VCQRKELPANSAGAMAAQFPKCSVVAPAHVGGAVPFDIQVAIHLK